MKNMIQKIVQKRELQGFSEVKENLAYWLSRTPEERIQAVEYLRKQYYGSTARLQRTARVIQRTTYKE
jgi:phage anti-repressor protein